MKHFAWICMHYIVLRLTSWHIYLQPDQQHAGDVHQGDDCCSVTATSVAQGTTAAWHLLPAC